MVEVSTPPKTTRNLQAFELPTPDDVDANTQAGASTLRIIHLANTALTAYREAYPAETGDTAALANIKNGGNGQISKLLEGEVNKETIQALITLLIGELTKLRDSGDAAEITSKSEQADARSEYRDEKFAEIGAKISDAYKKQAEAGILEASGYAAIGAGVALLAIPFIGWAIGGGLIAAGAALLTSAAIIKDQAASILATQSELSTDLAKQEATEAAENNSVAFDKLQKALSNLAATSITTNVNALLNVLGLAQFPNDLAQSLAPNLVQGYIDQGFSPEEATQKATTDSQAAANALTTVLVTTALLTTLSNTQASETDDSTAVVNEALTHGLQAASNTIQSSISARSGPININTLGETAIDAASSAIQEYFEAQAEALAESAPNKEAANALRGVVTGNIDESLALFKSVVPGLFSAQQVIQEKTAEFIRNAEIPDISSIPDSAKQPGFPDPRLFLADLLDKLGNGSKSTVNTLSSQKQGADRLEGIPPLA